MEVVTIIMGFYDPEALAPIATFDRFDHLRPQETRLRALCDEGEHK